MFHFTTRILVGIHMLYKYSIIFALIHVDTYFDNGNSNNKLVLPNHS